MKRNRRILAACTLGALVAGGGWTGCSSSAEGPPAETTNEAPDAARDAAPPDEGHAEDAADAAPFVTAAHEPWPALLPHSGRVLHPMKLVTIVAQNDDLATDLFKFGDALIASTWWKAAGGEYGVDAAAASVHVTGPAMTTSPDRAALLQYIASAISASGAPPPNGQTLYLVYLPSGLSVAGATFNAFHNAYPSADGGAGDGFAVVSRETPTNGETQLDQLTMVASHEIIEAATDPGLNSWRLIGQTAKPWTGSIWSAIQPDVIENGDLCEGARIREPLGTGYRYQRSWSVAAAAAGDAAAGDPCVPALGGPYMNVTVPEQWYPANAGQTVTIPFTGWSTARTEPWLVYVGVTHATAALKTLKPGAGLTISTSLGLGTSGTCFARQAMNNGETGTLTVTLPAGIVSGDYVVLTLRSFREAKNCYVSPDDDLSHTWPVGIYVP